MRNHPFVSAIMVITAQMLPLWPPGGVAAAATPSTTVSITDANVQVNLVLEKSKAQNLALQVMATYKPASQQYSMAKRLYSDAEQKFNSYTGVMLTNYAAGNRVELAQAANAAAVASKEFSDYVFSLNPHSRSAALIPLLVPALIEVGEALFKMFEMHTADKRKALADGLRPQITWDDWDKLGAA
jgi:hypothetical protein